MTSKFKLQTNLNTSLLFVSVHNQFTDYFTATIIYKLNFNYFEHEHKLVKSIDDAVDWSVNFIVDKYQVMPTIIEYN